MALGLKFAARSDVGLLRDENEDSGYAGPRLLAVADGMGGHAAGEVASSVALATISALDEDPPGPDLLDRLARAVEEANQQLRDLATQDPSLDGMGTTLTALLQAGSRLGVVHVGDSRCYLLRDGELEMITHDHTFVQTLVDEGRITEDEAGHHPQRSVILRALDGRGDIDLDLSVREARVGDRYLLCSDGLSGVVSADTLRETLAGARTPEHACDALVELALRGGGPDNITCIVADIVEIGSGVSDIPLVVGAAADDRVKQRAPAQVSAASRAAALRPAAKRAETASRSATGGRRRRWLRRGLLAAVLLVLVVGGGYAAWSWSQNQYFVSDDDDSVAIFNGLEQSFAGISLSSVYERQDIPLDDLSPYTRQRVEEGIAATDLDDAHLIVGRLRTEAVDCQAQRSAAAATPSPAASAPSGASTPSVQPVTTPSATPAPSASATPSVTPTPSTPAPTTPDCGSATP
jgi:protein phosphatase